jgi:hypothetical protein
MLADCDEPAGAFDAPCESDLSSKTEVSGDKAGSGQECGAFLPVLACQLQLGLATEFPPGTSLSQE